MTPREIQTLMNRLFFGEGGISVADGYRHLIREGRLSRELVDLLIEDYIAGSDVLIYLNAQECKHCRKDEAFSYIEKIYSLGRLRLTSPDFQGRILIEPIGVGMGSNKSHQKTTYDTAE